MFMFSIVISSYIIYSIVSMVIAIFISMHDCIVIIIIIISSSMPSPPTKRLGFEWFDSSKLLIVRGGNSHARRI